MIVAVASHKGGVGKTTTAIHLAAYFQTLAPTLLLDGDKTRNALGWSEAGGGLPFRTAPVSQATKLGPEYAAKKGHIILDTGQRPEGDELREAVEGCDVMVIPASPRSLDTRGLVQVIQALRAIGATNYRVLITMVPPAPEKEAAALRRQLEGLHVPLFAAEIPRLKAFEKAAAQGQIVSQVDDRNAARAWDAYAAAGEELLVPGPHFAKSEELYVKTR